MKDNGCLLTEEKRPCMGPMTNAGCGAICPSLNRVCEGCYGPMSAPNAESMVQILLETGLSFLGVGVQPPLPSLGVMLGTGRNFMLMAWWLPVLPGIVIFVTTLSVSILGDWLRDRLDTTLSR